MTTIRGLIRARRAKGWIHVVYQMDVWTEHVWHAPAHGEMPTRVQRVTWDGVRLSYYTAANPRMALIVLRPTCFADVASVLCSIDSLQLGPTLLALDGVS